MKTCKTLLLAALLAWHAGALAHGLLASLEPVARIQPGATTAAQVRELLGAPARVLRFRGAEVIEYDAFDFNTPIAISITIGADGKVRDVQRIHRSFP
jgi:hypothetical protein